MTLQEVKMQLKHNSKELRKMKKDLKQQQRQNKDIASSTMLTLYLLRKEVRHLYLAYGLVRGKKIEQMENRCLEDNKPNMAYVRKLVSQIKLPVDRHEEACCVSA